MKPGGYNITPPKGGMKYQRSQLTGILRSKSKLPFNCDHCGLLFETYACWAKRHATHFCGRACAWAARVIRFPKDCVICGTVMMLTASLAVRKFTCSYVCMRKKRVTNNVGIRASPDYMAIAKRLKKNAVCKLCGTLNGPWTVMGIKTWVEDKLSCAEGSKACLVCRHCHMKSVASLAVNSTYMVDRIKYYKEKNGGTEGDMC